jgi:N-dimethylarginine dimethylaminohydrolase
MIETRNTIGWTKKFGLTSSLFPNTSSVTITVSSIRSFQNVLDEPENSIIPDFEEKIAADQNIGHFLHLCLIRSVREDRTVLACNQFIKKVLGDYFT